MIVFEAHQLTFQTTKFDFWSICSTDFLAVTYIIIIFNISIFSVVNIRFRNCFIRIITDRYPIGISIWLINKRVTRKDIPSKTFESLNFKKIKKLLLMSSVLCVETYIYTVYGNTWNAARNSLILESRNDFSTTIRDCNGNS